MRVSRRNFLSNTAALTVLAEVLGHSTRSVRPVQMHDAT